MLTGQKQGIGTDTTSEHEGESNLIGKEHLLKTLRGLESIRALRGVNSRGVKDGGVNHPPRNRVKEDTEKTMIDDMYQLLDYWVPGSHIRELQPRYSTSHHHKEILCTYNILCGL